MKKVGVLLLLLISFTLLSGCKDDEVNEVVFYPEYITPDIVNLSNSEINTLFTNDGRSLYYSIADKYIVFMVSDYNDGVVYLYDIEKDTLDEIEGLESLATLQIACNSDKSLCIFSDVKDLYVVSEAGIIGNIDLNDELKTFTGISINYDNYLMIQYNASHILTVGGDTVEDDLGLLKTEIYNSDFDLVNSYDDCFIDGHLLFFDSKVYPYGTKTLYEVVNGERNLIESFDGAFHGVAHLDEAAYMIVAEDAVGIYYRYYYNSLFVYESRLSPSFIDDYVYYIDGARLSIYNIEGTFVTEAILTDLESDNEVFPIDDEHYLLEEQDALVLKDYQGNVVSSISESKTIAARGQLVLDNYYIFYLSSIEVLVIADDEMTIVKNVNGFDDNPEAIYYTALTDEEYKMYKNDGETVVEVTNILFEDYLNEFLDDTTIEGTVTMTAINSNEFIQTTVSYSSGNIQRSIIIFDVTGEVILEGIVLSYSSNQYLIVDSESNVFLFDITY